MTGAVVGVAMNGVMMHGMHDHEEIHVCEDHLEECEHEYWEEHEEWEHHEGMHEEHMEEWEHSFEGHEDQGHC